MKKKLYTILSTLGALLCLTSCSDFLEEYSQDTDYVRSWKDLDELLIGDCYWPVEDTQNFNAQSNQGMFIHLLADELEEQNSASSGRSGGMFDDHQRLFGYLTWQQRVGQNETYSGFFPENTLWTQAYKKINIANNILSSLSDVPQRNDVEREGAAKVEGEAHFLRAYYYWLLVNLYGQPYAPSTAATQLGVPLKTAPEVEDIKWQRNTVQEVYQLVERDLLAAESAFDRVTTEKKSIYRADQTAVRLLLSRVYLYMQQWQKAADYAQKVIDKHAQLQDLRTSTTPMMLKTNVENIFTMGGDDLPVMLDYTWQGLRVSKSQYDAYASNDLRRVQWLWKSGTFQGITLRENGGQYLSIDLPAKTSDTYYYYAYTYSLEYRTSPVSSLFWLRSAEAYLNLAEAQAYLGDEDAARATINTLRRARYATGSTWELTSTGSQLISDLRRERRCELVLQGHRWFDLRRYRVCTVQPEKQSITHHYTYYQERGSSVPLETHQFVLTEEDPSWTQPIPQEVLDFNTGMEGNGNLWREYTVVETEN
ncbi:MAG: RagB/SusD family nutrient uptake outer membrane protein [Bacteroidaceae bacterium]|nr:RagB/SusD family nutrient uptake outer membrane protein [Bacteroidaceae bacterium]